MTESRWLRETVEDEDISLLFTAVGDDLLKTISYTMDRAAGRLSVEHSLIDLLSLAVEERNDDTQGSVWIALILGEMRSVEAIPVLLRALAAPDETMADAAEDAFKRLGEPGFEAVMRALSDTEDPSFLLAGYRALEGAGAWEHPYLVEEVGDFLLDHAAAPDQTAAVVEGAALALARLGDRRALEPLKTLLTRRFKNINPSLRDAVEMLEENSAGVPMQVDLTAWEERVGWLSSEGFQMHDLDKNEPTDPARRRSSRPHTGEH